MSRACPSKGAPETAKVTPPAAKPPTAAAKGAAVRRRQIPETYIEIELLGRATHCLVDTGCDQSMIPLRMIGGCPLHYTDMEVYAANGARILVKGCIETTIMVQGQALRVTFLVSDEIDEIMLGFDWLKAQGAHWLFDEDVMVLHGQRIPCKDRESRRSCKRVYARERVVIPPYAESNVPVRLVKMTQRTPEAEWVVGPHKLQKNVFQARVLLPEVDRHAAV